jgi:hypothetical protein
MLSELLPAPAEDADRARLLEQDRVAVHRDLHRILLADAEPLPDLDRNHDATQLIDMPDDDCGSRSFQLHEAVHDVQLPRSTRSETAGSPVGRP